MWVNAPIEHVWTVFSDVERWSEWTEAVQLVAADSDGGIGLGAAFEIAQPLLSTACYEVTEFEPGRSWTWVATSPGLRTTATHRLDVVDANTTQVRQAVSHQGPFAIPVAWAFGGLTSRYLAMKANDLRERSESEGVST